MSQFLTPLDVTLLKEAHETEHGRALWRLDTDFQYESDRMAQVIIVPAGFETDFASVPRLILTWGIAGGDATKAAVVHDWLCGTEMPRADADAVFYEAMRVSGMSWWKARVMWAAVRIASIAS